ITLGSLSLRSKRLSAMANANVIAIQTKRSYDTVSRQTSSGSAIDGKELRNSRSASEGGQLKVELLRNRRIVLCPWNALAVHLYHKWHVLKEPPPDFSNPEWADEPLFQDGAALSDAHLQDFCDEHYREYKRAFEQGKQTYKCISQRTFAAMDVALSSSRMLRGAVSSSRTLHATQRVLQNGIYDKMLVSIAGFSTDSRAQPYHIARQHHGSFAEYEDVIFPFADYVPAYSENGLIGIEANHRQAIVGFCNVLKLLRTVLLQDAALMLYTPFYRQMLKHSSVFGQSVFLSDHFRDKVEAAGEALMTVECMPIKLGEELDSLSVARVRELNEMLDQLPRLADTVADQPWSGEPSKPTDMSVAHPANEEPSQDPVSSRASFSKESSSTVDELPTTKRRRTEANTVSSTMLRNVAAPKLHPVSNQRGNDNSSQRRESILSPSASIYLIEDEDGNFFDMPAVSGSFIEILDYDEGSDETVVATDGLGKSSDIQAIAPSDEGSSSPMDWEKISHEAVTDISFNIPTPKITPEAAVPESDSATEAAHFPEPTLPISSEGNDKLRKAEALQIPSDAPVSVYTTALAHNISELCRKKKLLLKSNIKLHKSLFAMRVFPKRITSLRAKTASALVKNGVVDIQAIEKMRKLNMWLHRTKEALAKLEEAVSSNNDLLCELMGSGVEEAVGCAVALLSQQSHDGTGQV
ncbi:hypothetical protein GGI18_001299, partial [Coemansia linderi]